MIKLDDFKRAGAAVMGTYEAALRKNERDLWIDALEIEIARIGLIDGRKSRAVKVLRDWADRMRDWQ